MSGKRQEEKISKEKRRKRKIGRKNKGRDVMRGEERKTVKTRRDGRYSEEE